MKPVITFGETMGLFRATALGSLAQVTEFALGIGGAESNVAIALSRLGTPVRWVGRVGADAIGQRVLRELRAEGVDVRGIVDYSAPTAVMVKEQRTNDVTRVNYYRAGSAGSRLTSDDIASADISSASLVHVTGITPALSNSAKDAVMWAISTARSAGVPVSFDVNHRSTLLHDDPGSTYREIASQADIVFAGEEEGRLLFPECETPTDLAAKICRLGPRQVIIKRGIDGCLALLDGQTYTQSAIPIRVVDTVGAGDAFVAGYLAEFLAGLPPTRRLTTAVMMGAFACLNPGDWEGFPTRDEFSMLISSEPVLR